MAVQMYGVASGTRLSLPERFERKYYVAPQRVSVACGLLRQICLPAREYASEQINSLYFDTPDLEQHQMSDSGDFGKDKVRIRWYGREEHRQGMQTAFLELKSRRGFAGTKLRLQLQVPAERLGPDSLRHGIVPGPYMLSALAQFGYFPIQMLVPVVKISYWRYRFDDIATEQRVSIDCRIHSTMVLPDFIALERELDMPGAVIEIKGRTMAVPVPLRQAKMLDIDWSRFSKYSASIDAHLDSPGTVGRFSPSGRLVAL